MKKRFATMALLPAAAMATFASASAGNGSYPDARPMVATYPDHTHLAPQYAPVPLAQWSGSYVDLKGNTVTFTMVGTDPSSTNATTNVKVLIIPIKMVYGNTNGNMTFDPNTHVVTGSALTVTQNTMASPLFQNDHFAPQHGACAPTCVHLGNKQYIDAFQRGNFWGNNVSTNTAYNVQFSPVVLKPEHTITVTAAQGKVMVNPFGSTNVGTMDINAFDARLQTIMAGIAAVNPHVLPVFVTYNIFLTSGSGCCVAGYHSATGAAPGGQTYVYSTYVDDVGSFGQDVSALSAQLGNWMDDPFAINTVHCNQSSLMEVGDPLLNTPNYGAYPYALGGFTYNLQSLVDITYFGAPVATSANGWYSIQDDASSFCAGQ
jgi:hypothetical protein